MPEPTKATLTKIAKITRNHIVDFAHNRKEDFAYPYVSPTLACWCAISSVVLQRRLKTHKIESTVINGNFDPERDIPDVASEGMGVNHAWVLVNGMYVDITASQFDHELPKVLVTKANDPRFVRMHVGKAAMQQFKRWPDDQSPVKPISKIKAILEFSK